MPVDPSHPDLLWTAVANRIRDDLSPMVFGAWFSTTRALALDGDVLEVGVPNEFTRSWIEGHFAELVRKAASAADPGVSVRFRVARRGRGISRLRVGAPRARRCDRERSVRAQAALGAVRASDLNSALEDSLEVSGGCGLCSAVRGAKCPASESLGGGVRSPPAVRGRGFSGLEPSGGA